MLVYGFAQDISQCFESNKDCPYQKQKLGFQSHGLQTPQPCSGQPESQESDEQPRQLPH